MVPRARLSCWFLRRAFGEELVSKFLDSPDCENIHPYAAPFTRCGQQDCEREFYRGLRRRKRNPLLRSPGSVSILLARNTFAACLSMGLERIQENALHIHAPWLPRPYHHYYRNTARLKSDGPRRVSCIVGAWVSEAEKVGASTCCRMRCTTVCSSIGAGRRQPERSFWPLC